MTVTIALLVASLVAMQISGPRGHGAAWLLLVVCVPPWVVGYAGATSLGFPFIASVALAILCWRMRPRGLTAVDLAVAIMTVSLGVSTYFGTPAYLSWQGISLWATCYVAGRLMTKPGLDGFAKSAGIIGSALAMLALAQLVFTFDLGSVLAWGNAGPPGDAWRPLQFRSDTVRSELTFGHSIALGGTLAILLAFACSYGAKRRRVVTSTFILMGVLATQSRGAILAAILVLTLSYLKARTTHATRFAVLVPAVALLAVLLPSLVNGFVLGGEDRSTEVAQGSQYRVALLSTIPFIRAFGLGEGAAATGIPGVYNWTGAYTYSLDNTPLYLGLYAGAVVAIAFMLASVLSVGSYKLERLSPFQIAIACQLPVLLIVAPITQFQSVFWFVVGQAVTWTAISRRTPNQELADTSEFPVEPTTRGTAGPRPR